MDKEQFEAPPIEPIKPKLKFELNDFKGGVRTASALLLGNSAVVPVLTNGQAKYWFALFILGVAGMLWSSFSRSKS
jgi:hypothetical protein